jgi:hypothetical protein
MSQHDVTVFLMRLTEDPALRAEVDVAGKSCDQQILALVLLGAKHGFDFTPDEVKAVLDTVMSPGREDGVGGEGDPAATGEKVRAGIRLTLDPCLGRLEYLGRPRRERLKTPHGVRRTGDEVTNETS